MPFQTLESSNISGFDYDPERKLLDVTFKDGAEWRYHGVEPHVAEGLANAESARKFLEQYVKPFHHPTRLR